jgi:hypothetical protein
MGPRAVPSPAHARGWSIAARLFAIDARSLAALRIALGALLLVDLGQGARYLDVHYTDAGVLPRAILGRAWSLHALGGSAGFEAALFAVAAAAALLMLIGYRTRGATVVSWILLVSLHNRSPQILDGGDALLAMLLFWSMFLPLGACWSIDARLGRTPAAARVYSAATIALMLQFVFLYALGGLMKTGDDWHITGTAIARALQQSYWSHPPGDMLLRYPDLLRWLSLAVPWFEIAGTGAMFMPIWTAPIRVLTIIAFVIFQAGLALSIQLNLFPWVSSTALLPFVPGGVWDRLTGERPGAPEVTRLSGWIGDALVTAVLCYCVVANVSALGLFPLPLAVRTAAHSAGMIQGWTMYAPHSARIDLRFQLGGEGADGRLVDLSANAPPRLQALNETRRFKYFLESMLRGDNQAQLRKGYLDWVCRAEAPLGKIYLYVVMRQLPDGPWRRTLILDQDCRTGQSFPVPPGHT